MKRLKASATFAGLILVGLTFGQDQQLVETLSGDSWSKALAGLRTRKSEVLSEVIRCLANPNAKIRARAAYTLQFFDTEAKDVRSTPEEGLGSDRPTAVEALKLAAGDQDQNVRERAIYAMAYLLRNRDYGQHGEAWSDPNEVTPIVQLGKVATGPLSKLLMRQDKKDVHLYSAKISAIRALVSINDPTAYDALASVVRLESGWLMSEAMDALSSSGDPRAVRTIIDCIDRGIGSYEDTPGVWALIRMKERAVPDLLWAIQNHPRSKVRGYAAHVFYHNRHASSPPTLQKATREKDGFVRAMATQAMTKNADSSNHAIFVRLLNDSDEDVREQAVLALQFEPRDGDFEKVSKLLQDKSTMVRRRVINTLIAINPSRSVRLILPLMMDKDVAVTAIRAIAPLRPPEANSILIKILRDTKGESKYALKEAVDYAGDIKLVAAIPHLLNLVDKEDWYIQSYAAEALGKIGLPAAEGIQKLLRKAPKDADQYLLTALGTTRHRDAFETIVPYLDTKVQYSAIDALGELNDRRAVPFILKYLATSDDRIVRISAESAGKMKMVEAVPQLIGLLSSKLAYVPGVAAEVLGKIGGNDAFEALLKVTADPKFEDMWQAVEALGVTGDRRALPILIQYLKPGNPRNYGAALGLGKLGDPAALPALENAAKSDHAGLAEAAKSAIKMIKSKGKSQ